LSFKVEEIVEVVANHQSKATLTKIYIKFDAPSPPPRVGAIKLFDGVIKIKTL